MLSQCNNFFNVIFVLFWRGVEALCMRDLNERGEDGKMDTDIYKNPKVYSKVWKLRILCFTHNVRGIASHLFFHNSTGRVNNRCENSELLLTTLFCKRWNISPESHQKGTVKKWPLLLSFKIRIKWHMGVYVGMFLSRPGWTLVNLSWPDGSS